MALSERIGNFFLPPLSRRFLIRLVLLGLSCYLVFTYLLIPLRIQGQSMEPTYEDGSFGLCWRPQYLFSSPGHGDIVTVRFAGRRVMLLKRVVGLGGETVEFRQGILYRDGKMVEEPYVRFRADWNLPPRTVAPGHVYVVGDNRGTPMERHRFGQISVERIVGGVLL